MQTRKPLSLHRRRFLSSVSQSTLGLAAAAVLPRLVAAAPASHDMQFGLVTYLWGQHMDLPTLLSSCEASGLLGVELRTQHKHGVEPSLSKAERLEVKRRFNDSPVTLVGYGSNAEYHSPDPQELERNIELTKEYIRLMHDCGGTGVKVKPNNLPDDVPAEKTIEQIGRALNVVAEYGAGFGQQIRVEVHGRKTSELPIMQAIFEVADHPNATICWNCNEQDLQGEGLEHNFNLVKDRFGDTVHVRELNVGSYPYAELMQLFLKNNYAGWILLEARTNPSDKVAAMSEQRKVFDKLTSR